MTRDEYYQSALGEFEKRWRSGEFPALADAVEFCHVTEVPVPAWLAEAVMIELHAAFHGLGPRDRGMGQGHKARLKALQEARMKELARRHAASTAEALVRDGWQTEAAVARAMELSGLPRSEVFDALSEWRASHPEESDETGD